MKHFDDDVPQAEELRRNTQITTDTKDIIDKIHDTLVEREQKVDMQLKILSRENTRNTILLVAIAAAVGALLALGVANL